MPLRELKPGFTLQNWLISKYPSLSFYMREHIFTFHKIAFICVYIRITKKTQKTMHGQLVGFKMFSGGISVLLRTVTFYFYKAQMKPAACTSISKNYY